MIFIISGNFYYSFIDATRDVCRFYPSVDFFLFFENPKLRFNCSIDNERAIQLRLPVGEGFESSNGTSVGGGNRYIYQIESNQSSSRDQFNQSNSTKPPITNHTDIVTTSTTSINWCPLLLRRSLIATIFWYLFINFGNCFFYLFIFSNLETFPEHLA